MKYLVFLAALACATGCLCCGGLSEAGEITQTAYDSEDPTPCSQISNEILQIGCCVSVGQKFNETAFCDKTADKACRDYCYTGVASSLKNQKICDGIQNASIKNACKNQL